MFGLGIWEIALIAVVALLVLGPDKLPEAARSLGRALNDFKRAGDDMRREIMDTPAPPPPVAIKKPEDTVAKSAAPEPAAASGGEASKTEEAKPAEPKA